MSAIKPAFFCQTLRSENGTDLFKRGPSRFDQFPGYQVSINEWYTQLFKTIGNSGLAAANPAGQADYQCMPCGGQYAAYPR